MFTILLVRLLQKLLIGSLKKSCEIFFGLLELIINIFTEFPGNIVVFPRNLVALAFCLPRIKAWPYALNGLSEPFLAMKPGNFFSNIAFLLVFQSILRRGRELALKPLWLCEIQSRFKVLLWPKAYVMPRKLSNPDLDGPQMVFMMISHSTNIISGGLLFFSVKGYLLLKSREFILYVFINAAFALLKICFP